MRIVFFDGYCGLCNSLVDVLMRADKHGRLKWAPLQGPTALQTLGTTWDDTTPDTIVYLQDGQRWEQSTAVLKILGDIGGVWSVGRFLLVIPKSLRDRIYMWIAKNRYRLIRKRDSCRVPTARERDRLLP